MKKTYMIPSQKIAELEMEALIAQSPNNDDIAAFSAVGDEYDAGDVSYGKADKSSMWDNLW